MMLFGINIILHWYPCRYYIIWLTDFRAHRAQGDPFYFAQELGTTIHIILQSVYSRKVFFFLNFCTLESPCIDCRRSSLIILEDGFSSAKKQLLWQIIKVLTIW